MNQHPGILHFPFPKRLLTPISCNEIKMRGQKQIKLKLGVCAMEKKVQSKPMQEILKRVKALNSNLEVIEFSNE